RADIPPQRCQVVPESALITLFTKDNECWLDIGDNTLWRAAVELGKFNHATVYQNVYGLFLTNRGAFVGGDINRL
ncbi:MAG: hypothetical protein ACRC5D_03985, partial [Aeromonas allosaccharophila]